MNTAQPENIKIVDGKEYPISNLKEDMEILLLYARNNDNCNEDEIDKIDAIQARWGLEYGEF